MDNTLWEEARDAGGRDGCPREERETAGWGGGSPLSRVLFVFTGFSLALALLYFLNLIPYEFINHSTKKHEN